uniref:Uncharacterized protein n=1 Tax=Panagrolaimus sp. PS1159 TaxID=55785 RepID=A0AC35F3F4_9BILA
MSAQPNYRMQDTYEPYTRDNPRRSERDRSVVVRYHSEFTQHSYNIVYNRSRRTRSRSRAPHLYPRDYSRSPLRSSSRFHSRPSYQPSRSGSPRQSYRNYSRPLQQYRGNSRAYSQHGLNFGSFKDNFYRRGFITGAIRPPTPDEVSTLCSYVKAIRTFEIEIIEQISRSINNPESKVVFKKVIQNLKNAMDTSKIRKEHYEELIYTKEMVDISTFVVYFWNMFVEIIQRDIDIIYYSRSKISNHSYDEILTGYKVRCDFLKEDFEKKIDRLEMSEDSLNFFDKYALHIYL